MTEYQTVVILQAAAFTKKALKNQGRGRQKDLLQTAFVTGAALLYISPMLLLTAVVAYLDFIALEAL
ncbi:hypothetical protein C6Y45_13345 [Alkalicoccus saliphilus]|uniref:Uncharacterized protein n=1 Tax=Alkalicoccus saliphilus TaxID=200989 RepID=A0A2T4U3U8_9BACI|nr:hypothetical protein C6Y45_13345 [Alkalicoccus saliphilus]